MEGETKSNTQLHETKLCTGILVEKEEKSKWMVVRTAPAICGIDEGLVALQGHGGGIAKLFFDFG